MYRNVVNRFSPATADITNPPQKEIPWKQYGNQEMIRTFDVEKKVFEGQ
jgi:hypothetical protein